MPPSPLQNKTMNFRRGTKWCGSPFLSNCYLPLFYLRKTKHWSLLCFKGFFSVSSFCCYCFCVLYFLFLFTSIFFSLNLSFFPFFLLLLVLWCCWKQDRRECSVWPISWFLELRQPIKWAGFSFSFSAGFPRCCYVPASSLTSSAKLRVEASVNTFRCGNTNSLVRKCT